MPRRLRLFIPGLTQHLIQRGNNRTKIFQASRDYEVFLDIAREAVLKHRLDLHAYALMPNHVHLMVTAPTNGAIPAVMQALGRRYVPYFNRQYRRSGGLFEGRYHSFLVDDERYWMRCMRYIELNPVRAGLAAAAGDYRWTSYRAHGLGAPDLILVDHPLYLQLGDTVGERRRCWQAFCAEGISENELSELSKGGVVPGSDPGTTPV